MIVVECNADEKLVRSLSVRGKVRHERGKGEVLKHLKRIGAGIGVIDEDPESHQPRELQYYALRESGDELAGLRRLSHQKEPTKKVIVIRPRLEDWLYRRAYESNLNPQKYGLPADAAALHSIPRYHEKPGFEKFLDDLRQCDSEVKKLEEWLSR